MRSSHFGIRCVSHDLIPACFAVLTPALADRIQI